VTRQGPPNGRAGAWAAGLGAYLAGLIVIAPATLADAGLQRASHGRMGIAEAHGTLWSGAGQLEIRDANRRTGISQGVTWRFLPEDLLRGRLAWTIEQGASRGPITVAVSSAGIELANVDIQLPAAVLGLAVPRLAPLKLRGDLHIRANRVGVDGNHPRGDATLQWRSAGSPLTPVEPLGDYELRLEEEGAGVRMSLRTLQGPLQLDGSGNWTNGHAPRLQATARIPAELEPQLAPLLRMFSVERGKGLFELRLDSR